MRHKQIIIWSFILIFFILITPLRQCWIKVNTKQTLQNRRKEAREQQSALKKGLTESAKELQRETKKRDIKHEKFHLQAKSAYIGPGDPPDSWFHGIDRDDREVCMRERRPLGLNFDHLALLYSLLLWSDTNVKFYAHRTWIESKINL